MRVIVFDTETIDIKDLDIFDFGFTVIDTETKQEIAKGSYLISEIYNTPLFERAYYYNKNKEVYEKKVKEGIIELVTLAEARALFNKAIIDNKVDVIGGFIIDFDIRALNFNFSKYCGETNPITKEKLAKSRQVVDISLLFSLLEKKYGDYIEWCQQYGHVTDKGNIKSTAEVIYKYITNNHEHEEEHTAYSDTVEEAAVLQYCIDSYKDKEDFDLIWKEAVELTIKGGKKAWQILK